MTGTIVPGQLPVRGLNYRDPPARQMPDDAFALVNALSDSGGITLRNGYQEYATNVPGETIGTIMSYYPATSASLPSPAALPQSVVTRRRQLQPTLQNVVIDGLLFAAAGNRIFNITGGGAGPWVPQSGTYPSNYWTWRNFQNAAGNFLIAVNDLGSYIIYGGAGFSSGFSSGFRISQTGFQRVSAASVTGVNPDTFCHVTVWKRRLWFTEIRSTRAWYLPPEQLGGEARQFDFGPLFRHGGHLVSINSWTMDGGEGLDDYLVALSSEGDVVIYKGYDPDSAATDPSAFQLHGIWYIGALPKGRRQTDPYGGDLYILSRQGINQVSKLVSMAQVAESLVGDNGDRIDPYIANLMKNSADEDGWYFKSLPSEQMIIVGIPEQLTGEGPTQLGFKLRESAWSLLYGLPVTCWTNHDGHIFAGGLPTTPIDGQGKVFVMFENSTDGAALDNALGALVKARITPAYSAMGSPGMLKRFPMIRPTVLTQFTPGLEITILENYEDTVNFNVPTLPSIESARWNIDKWNHALWSGPLRPIQKWLGTHGDGYTATVQLDIVGLGGTTLTGIDWWVVAGGPL